MLPLTEIKTIFLAYMQAELPARLAAVSKPNFDKYQDHYPDNTNERILGMYSITGTHTMAYSDEEFMVHAQLPSEFDPDVYIEQMQKVTINFGLNNIQKIKATSLEFEHETYPPGESGDGGSSAFALLAVKFIDAGVDDCMDENNY